jgi:hypothetical protein
MKERTNEMNKSIKFKFYILHLVSSFFNSEIYFSLKKKPNNYGKGQKEKNKNKNIIFINKSFIYLTI